MDGRRRCRVQARPPSTLMFAGPLAIAGVIGGAFVGQTFLAQPPVAGADTMIVAGRVSGGQRKSSEPMVVRVRLSSPLQALLQQDSVITTVPGGATVGTLLNQLSVGYPVLASMGPSVMIAVSGSMASPDTLLVDGETVELMSPMAGG